MIHSYRPVVRRICNSGRSGRGLMIGNEDLGGITGLASASHPVHLWFRPLIAQRLNGKRIGTLGALVEYCNARGGNWWRSVPRIGALRARTIVAWLRRHEATLGVNVAADVDTASLVPTGAAKRDDGETFHAGVIVIGGDPSEPRLAPFEHLAMPATLSGGEGDHRGLNRATTFAFIRAECDLAAVHAYLHRYRDRRLYAPTRGNSNG